MISNASINEIHGLPIKFPIDVM